MSKSKPEPKDDNPFKPEQADKGDKSYTVITANETYVTITDVTENKDGSVTQSQEIIERKD